LHQHFVFWWRLDCYCEHMARGRITTPLWETFSMFVSLEDGHDQKKKIWRIHPDLLTESL
jgi:hypothetical protein